MTNQTAEELMRNVLSDGYTLTEDVVVLLMKMYANNKLNIASKNATASIFSEQGFGDQVEVYKESILKFKDKL